MTSERRNIALAVRAARVAGFCYVAIIGLGISQAAFIASRVRGPGDPAAPTAIVTDHNLLFRLGIVSDVVLYTLVLVLSVALYLVVREVHQGFALGALVLRSAEGVVGLAVTVLGGLVPLLLLSDSASADPSTAAAFLALRESALDVILMLIGPGGAAFCYLFLRSRLVPTALALWGVLTYLSMSILGGSRILLPELPASVTIFLYAQGGLFEVLFGLWLLFKTVDVSAYRSIETMKA